MNINKSIKKHRLLSLKLGDVITEGFLNNHCRTYYDTSDSIWVADPHEYDTWINDRTVKKIFNVVIDGISRRMVVISGTVDYITIPYENFEKL